jgi:hypothetical protein
LTGFGMTMRWGSSYFFARVSISPPSQTALPMF